LSVLGHFFYTIFFGVLSFFMVPVSLLKILFSKKSPHRERWGMYPQKLLLQAGQKQTIWFHTASVGEVMVALTLMRAMRKTYPRHRIVITTTTPQGRARAAQDDVVDAALLAPFDIPWIVRRAVKRIRPSFLLVTETELWPNLLKGVKQEGIPIVLFNGRISRRSYRFYRPLRFFFRGVLKNFDALCLKSNSDKERMVKLGAIPQSIHVTGDIKFHHLSTLAETEKKRLEKELRLPLNVPVVIAGSTHEGEEEMVLQIFKELKADFSRLILVLAPRHLQRIPRVERVLKSQGVRWIKRTMIQEERRPEEVILLDTIGELTAIYGLGTAVFVGGSFGRVGGHNILEVLAQGKGVIFGPHVETIRDVAQLVVEHGAGLQVRTPDELKGAFKKLIADSSLRAQMGKKGRSFLQEQQGALERTMKIVEGVYQG
jgi:3-deoxy-D-manno-octulosonic-acid transferase